MEYKDGPPLEFHFSIIEHMWLGLPRPDLVMTVDETDQGQHRADQLLVCVDRLLAQSKQRRDLITSDYQLRRLQLDRRESMAREILKRVAPFVSCDAEEVSDYLIAVTDDPDHE